MATYLYRCKKRIKSGLSKGKTCDTRRALRHPIEWYIRKPKCRCCGAELKYLDKWQRKKNRAKTCTCDGAHYPHREGSVELCKYYVRKEEDYVDVPG